MKPSPSDSGDVNAARLLIAKYCDGHITTDQAAMLESLVCRSSEIRRLYILTVALHADLYMQAALLSPNVPKVGAAGAAEPAASLDDSIIIQAIQENYHAADDVPSFPRPNPQDLHRTNQFALLAMVRWRWFYAAAVAVVLCFCLATWFSAGPKPLTADLRVSTPSAVEKGSQTLARLDLALNPAWVDDHALADGERVGTGMVRLKAGVTRLVMDSGVVVILDGATELSLQNKNRLRLMSGRVTLRVPHPETGFTVETRSGNVTDIGTEFGVYVPAESRSSPSQTETVVFEGSVRLECSSSVQGDKPSQIARTGQAFALTQQSIASIADASTLGAFVRNRDFERRRSALNFAKAIVTNPDLLAYSFFDSDFDRVAAEQNLPAGLQWRSMERSYAVPLTGTSLGLGNATGSTLFLDGQHVAVLDLDTTVNSQLAEHGYIGSSGCVKGSGKILYLSWLSKAVRSSPAGSGGLSLVYADGKQSDEYVFLGQSLDVPNFSCRVLKDAGMRSPGASRANIFELNSDPVSPEIRPLAVDNKMHLWVLKIEFSGGSTDQTSVYVDPGADEPPQPNLVFQSVDLQFNKIRLSSGPHSTWEFGRFLVGSSFDAVVPR